MDSLLPVSDVVQGTSVVVVSGLIVGLGFAMTFWLGGYTVGSLLKYLRGGY